MKDNHALACHMSSHNASETIIYARCSPCTEYYPLKSPTYRWRASFQVEQAWCRTSRKIWGSPTITTRNLLIPPTSIKIYLTWTFPKGPIKKECSAFPIRSISNFNFIHYHLKMHQFLMLHGLPLLNFETLNADHTLELLEDDIKQQAIVTRSLCVGKFLRLH